jgi:hypothetical protein
MQNLLPKSVRDREPLGYVDMPAEVAAGLNHYILQVRGECLAPYVLDGDRIVLSPVVELERGMIAAIFSHDGAAAIKRLATVPPPKPWTLSEDSECGYLLGMNQHNPPRGYWVPLERVEEVHAAIGVIRDGAYIALEVRS